MYKFIYPAVVTTANFVFTILAYLPTIFLMEMEQPVNICKVGEKVAQKFEFLFLSYGFVFSISPLILNVVLNAYITSKMR